MPAKVTIGGIDLAVGAYSQHKDLAFQAALCLRDAQNQLIGATVGGVPPTIASLYNNPKLFPDYPFHADILSALQNASVRPQTPVYQVVSIDLSHQISPADEDQPAGHRAGDGRPDKRRSRSPRAWSREPKEDPMSTTVPATGTTTTPAHAKGRRGRAPLSEGRQAGAPPRVLAGRPRGPGDGRGDRLPARLRDHPVPGEVQPGVPAGHQVHRVRQLRGGAQLASTGGSRSG